MLQQYYERTRANPAAKPENPRELMIEQHFMPWFVGFLRDLKAENVTLHATPALDEQLKTLKVKTNKDGSYDLSRLDKAQYLAFRSAFVENRMMDPQLKASETTKLVLTSLCLVLCKRVPAECEIPRISRLHDKVRLLQPAAPVEGEAGAVLVLKGQKSVGPEENDFKALVCSGVSDKLSFRVTVLNELAATNFRDSVLCALQKALPDIADSDLEKIQKEATRQHSNLLNKVLAAHSELPVFEHACDF